MISDFIEVREPQSDDAPYECVGRVGFLPLEPDSGARLEGTRTEWAIFTKLS